MKMVQFESNEEISLKESLVAIFDEWLKQRANSVSTRHGEKALSDQTSAVYKEMWSSFAAWCASQNLMISDLRMKDLESFLASRGLVFDGDRPKAALKSKEISPKYARRYLTLIDRVTRLYTLREGVQHNTAAIDLLEQEKYKFADASTNEMPPEYLTDDESSMLRDYLCSDIGMNTSVLPWKQVRDRTAIALMLGAGLTPGDVRAAKIHGISSVTEGGEPNQINLPSNGTTPSRDSTINEWARQLLAQWIEVRKAHSIEGEFLFPSTSAGKEWSHSRCFESGKAVLDDAGISTETGGLFKLRHTYAIEQLLAGKKDADIARWMGLIDVNGLNKYKQIAEEIENAFYT